MQVVLRSLIALYACLRSNSPLRAKHSESVLPHVLAAMQTFPAVAKVQLFACWILYELAQEVCRVMPEYTIPVVRVLRAVNGGMERPPTPCDGNCWPFLIQGSDIDGQGG
jgi:hypothetical protein